MEIINKRNNIKNIPKFCNRRRLFKFVEFTKNASDFIYFLEIT